MLPQEIFKGIDCLNTISGYLGSPRQDGDQFPLNSGNRTGSVPEPTRPVLKVCV